jgi:hypothetical protein
MIIYKVVNDKDKSIVEYFLKRETALNSLKDLQMWFTDSFHVESEFVDDCLGDISRDS